MTVWHRLEIRQTERGLLAADFAVLLVWTVEPEDLAHAEQLVLWREASGELTYTLFWSPEAVPTTELIRRSCVRYFVERVFEDGKDCLGWAEFQGVEIPSLVSSSGVDGAGALVRCGDQAQLAAFGTARSATGGPTGRRIVAALSTANVRQLLQPVLPLPSLSQEHAIELVVGHLLRRTASTRSRLKPQQPPASAP